MRSREELKRHPMFVTMERIVKYMDRYYIDGIVGLIPVAGDIAPALFTVPFVYFTAAVVRSVPLTLAVINNTLRDVLIGMMPFFIGNVLDFFYRSNSRNLNMIIGFVNGDSRIINEVNRKATVAAAVLLMLVVLIVAAVLLLVKLGGWLLSLL